MNPHASRRSSYRIAVFFLLFGMGSTLGAPGIHANECPLGPPTWWFARNHGTPIHERPDASAPVMGRLGQGYPLIVRVPACPGAKAKPRAWIRIEEQNPRVVPVGGQVPAGWIQYVDFLQTRDFVRVSDWPFAFLIIGADVYFEVYCFRPDGRLRRQTHMEDHAPSPENRSRLYQHGDIIAATEFEYRDDLVTTFVLYDRKRQRLCPIGLNETECDRFLEKDKGYSWQFALASDLRNASKDSPLRKTYEAYCSEIPKPEKK